MAPSAEPRGPARAADDRCASQNPPASEGIRSGSGSPVLELLQPGAFVKLRNQPEDLPPFQLIGCRGGRCWVRQQAWGRLVHWEVAHRQLTAVA